MKIVVTYIVCLFLVLSEVIGQNFKRLSPSPLIKLVLSVVFVVDERAHLIFKRYGAT